MHLAVTREKASELLSVSPSPQALRPQWRPSRQSQWADAPDPVFAVIEALKAATARIDEIRDIRDHAVYEEACRAEEAAFDELTETPPVTLPGMRALLVFLDGGWAAIMATISTIPCCCARRC